MPPFTESHAKSCVAPANNYLAASSTLPPNGRRVASTARVYLGFGRLAGDARHDVTGEQVNGTEDGANRAVQEVHQTNDREGDDHGNQL